MKIKYMEIKVPFLTLELNKDRNAENITSLQLHTGGSSFGISPNLGNNESRSIPLVHDTTKLFNELP